MFIGFALVGLIFFYEDYSPILGIGDMTRTTDAPISVVDENDPEPLPIPLSPPVDAIEDETQILSEGAALLKEVKSNCSNRDCPHNKSAMQKMIQKLKGLDNSVGATTLITELTEIDKKFYAIGVPKKGYSIKKYTVKKSDTAEKIANKHGIIVSDVYKYNKDSVIKKESGGLTYYKVTAGEIINIVTRD